MYERERAILDRLEFAHKEKVAEATRQVISERRRRAEAKEIVRNLRKRKG